MKEIKDHILKILKKNGVNDANLEVPPSLDMGDYAFGCFPLAKELKEAPNQIAIELKEKIKSDNIIEKVEANGPYLNFFVKREVVVKNVIDEVLNIKSKKKNDKKIMVEFCQTNTHKAFHVGHIRGTSLGESLSRILDFEGNTVIRANYQGDTGMHVAKWIWCYTNFHKDEELKNDESWFASIYVDAIKRLSENIEEKNSSKTENVIDYEEQVKEINKRLDSGNDKELNELWKKTRKLCLDSLEKIYKELNTHFDHYFFESEVEEDAKKICNELVKKGVAEVSDGAIIVNLEKYNLGVFVLIRSDGTALYGGKDIALAAKKFEKLNIDTSIYVVGKEQEFYFKQVFKILELMGFSDADKCRYVPVSLVKLPTGKMSSRTGDNILYSDFKNELVEYAEDEIKKRFSELDKKEVSKRALAISIAAMKYSMLKQGPNKEIVFNKREALNFEGDSGPYLQYSYARANSIIKKSTKKDSDYKIDNIHDKEILLIKKIDDFSNQVERAANDLNPALIANYALSLAQSFNEFYGACKVIGGKEEAYRIKLVEVFKITLKNALTLLGIDALEQM